MEWWMRFLVTGFGFHSRQTKWLLPPYYDVAQVFGSIWNQLVKEIGSWSSCEVRSVNVVVVHCIGLVIGFSSKLSKWLLPPYYDVSQVLGSIGNQLVKEIGHFYSLEFRSVNGVVDTLQSSSNWISLKTHRMTTSTILWCFPSFGLDPKSIGQTNWTLQVCMRFVP